MVKEKKLEGILRDLYNDSLEDTAYGTNKENKNIAQAKKDIIALIKEKLEKYIDANGCIIKDDIDDVLKAMEG